MKGNSKKKSLLESDTISWKVLSSNISETRPGAVGDKSITEPHRYLREKVVSIKVVTRKN